MQNKKLLILTSRFPYEGGEYFLETESKYWWKPVGVDVYILPFFRTKSLRTFPEWIDLRTESSKNKNRLYRIRYLIMALISPLFWGELIGLASARNIKAANLYRALLAISRLLQAKNAIEKISREVGGIDLVYSYWNSTSAYAAALLKKKGLVRAIVTRAHGSDLYRYALKNSYMPLKDRLVDQFDLVAVVSQRGRDYYLQEYSISPEKVVVSRLGVEIDGRLSPVTASGELSVVSISNCVKIKRLDVIAAGVLLFAAQNPRVNVTWTHIGDGPTLSYVEELWRASALKSPNSKAVFLGRLSNKSVISFITENPCDLVINASASEGVPVSLMEAMSAGIPAVAPTIGGIPELVSVSRGFLMPPMPTAEDVAKGLDWGLKSAKSPKFRKAAAAFIADEYSAPRVYSDFYELVLSRA